MDMDRFQPPNEPRVHAYCAWCRDEIYVGDAVTTYSNGDRTHSGECEDEYIRAEFGIERIVAE